MIKEKTKFKVGQEFILPKAAGKRFGTTTWAIVEIMYLKGNVVYSLIELDSKFKHKFAWSENTLVEAVKKYNKNF